MKRIFYLLLTVSVLISCSTYKSKKNIPYTHSKITKSEVKGKGTLIASEEKKLVTTTTNPTAAIPTKVVHNKKDIAEKPDDIKVLNIIDIATSFNGTKYKFGGTTSAGMDCSGLVYTAFKEEEIHLPRSSRDMSTRGDKISFQEISKGDLVFFKTNRNRNVINHVGLVVEVLPGKVLFIHSTSSLGVIISSLDERYWNESFAEARRII